MHGGCVHSIHRSRTIEGSEGTIVDKGIRRRLDISRPWRTKGAAYRSGAYVDGSEVRRYAISSGLEISPYHRQADGIAEEV